MADMEDTTSAEVERNGQSDLINKTHDQQMQGNHGDTTTSTGKLRFNVRNV